MESAKLSMEILEQFWTPGTCLTLCEMLETSTSVEQWALGKTAVKTDPLQGAISREAHFFLKIFGPILSTV